eukprot:Gb_25110 [translate_table: standard]
MKAMEYSWNWKSWYLILYLMFLCGSVEVAAPLKTVHSCPLDFTRLKAHPWMLQQCIQSDTAHCCEAVLDLIKILLFSHLHTHKLFLLPNNRTAAACLETFQQQLRAKGVPEEVLAGCKSVPECFVSHPQSCNGISNLSDFETAVDPSAMRRNCNGSQNLEDVGNEPNKIDLEIAIPVALEILFLLSILVTWKRSYCMRGSRHRTLLQRHQLLRESVDVSHGLVFFSLSEIRTSTGNFMASNVIGEGGFSTVYRGILSDGSPIAVKRFKDYTAKGDINFTHEVQVISSVRHRNLMPLKGYCIERNDEGFHEQLLIYDFMANGSLADYLFKKDKPCLSWDERHKIAVGVARGLAYLHEDAKPAIIHRDVKAANVLVDADLNALIADFGLAKFKPEESKTHYTTRAVGTPGYVAPERGLALMPLLSINLPVTSPEFYFPGRRVGMLGAWHEQSCRSQALVEKIIAEMMPSEKASLVVEEKGGQSRINAVRSNRAENGSDKFRLRRRQKRSPMIDPGEGFISTNSFDH